MELLSLTCRPLADPISITYFNIKFSMSAPVSPVSSRVFGSAGRKLSSERIEASRLPEEVEFVSTAVMKIALRGTDTLGTIARSQERVWTDHRPWSGNHSSPGSSGRIDHQRSHVDFTLPTLKISP